ncbi:hypothetical protein IHE55_00900 [Streptomyces pactum]|uniref:ATP-binding protein n=1 Tax=Streptomyces pactum TaxID=68249 RepID=A0ABS0NE14_9ACTN|nr:hypothetical protein [Streptomyces pactum]MBH5333434.1 hypothetical protein [Streptomyces pactum]
MRIRSAVATTALTAAVVLGGAVAASAADVPAGSGGAGENTQSAQRTSAQPPTLLESVGLQSLIDRTELAIGGLTGR